MVQPAIVGAGAAIVGFILGKDGKKQPVYAEGFEPAIPRFWAHGQVKVPTAGTPVAFPPLNIPEGMEVLIFAWPENTGYIYLANNQSEAADINRAFWGLSKGQRLLLDIPSGDMLWVNATVNNEGISYIVRRKSGKSSSSGSDGGGLIT